MGELFPLMLLAIALGCSALLFSPLLWVWLFKGANVSATWRLLLFAFLVMVGAAFVLGPSVWQSTLGQGLFDNPGLPFIPMVLVVYGPEVALPCFVAGAAVTLVAWLVVGKEPADGSSRDLAER